MNTPENNIPENILSEDGLPIIPEENSIKRDKIFDNDYDQIELESSNQTFSIDDIGEWPEREQDYQYIVQIKQIIPAKKLNEKQTSDEL
jgi:hypothetical protein